MKYKLFEAKNIIKCANTIVFGSFLQLKRPENLSLRIYLNGVDYASLRLEVAPEHHGRLLPLLNLANHHIEILLNIIA